MATILVDNIYKRNFEGKVLYLCENFTEACSWGSNWIDSKSELVQVMAWRRTIADIRRHIAMG